MKIILASNNQGKLTELRALFAPLGFELIAQADLGVPEAAEPFHTFVENALAKARHAAQYSGLPAVADDAGLCVDAFGGQPGVDTAYYATRFGYEVRSAQDPEPLIAVGRVVGEITREPIGSNGFGFDPVMFIPEFGQTFAQLPVEVKNANSHRGRAAQAMVALMRERWL
jgi:XTP/dITP diphosphohydrolase